MSTPLELFVKVNNESVKLVTDARAFAEDGDFQAANYLLLEALALSSQLTMGFAALLANELEVEE